MILLAIENINYITKYLFFMPKLLEQADFYWNTDFAPPNLTH